MEQLDDIHEFIRGSTIEKFQHVGTYNLTNPVVSQIRKKSDLGLSRIDLPSVGQFGKPRSLFSRIDLQPG